MENESLPLELLLRIATTSPVIFKTMMAIPSISRMTVGDSRKYVFSLITNIIITKTCTKYMLGNILHREDGPALITRDGTMYYYRMGKIHRDGGPAIIIPNGGVYWCKDGNLHREDGPAIISDNGSKFWYQNGLRHRINGPAIEYSNGGVEWHQNNELHREDGPAIIWPDGSEEWYQHGVIIDSISCDATNLISFVFSATSAF